MSPDLAEAFVDHLDRLRRSGDATGPDDFVPYGTACVAAGPSHQRVAEIVLRGRAAGDLKASSAEPPASAANHTAQPPAGRTSRSRSGPTAST